VAGTVVRSDQDVVYMSYEWLRTLIVEAGVVVLQRERGEGQPVDRVVLEPLQE
jgi:hypothetical protein